MDIGFIIDGAADRAEGGATFERHDPVTGAVATRAAAATVADVDRVVGAASRAFEGWSQTGPGERRALLLKAADLLESRTADFTRLMLEETGATAPWAGSPARSRTSARPRYGLGTTAVRSPTLATGRRTSRPTAVTPW